MQKVNCLGQPLIAIIPWFTSVLVNFPTRIVHLWSKIRETESKSCYSFHLTWLVCIVKQHSVLIFVWESSFCISAVSSPFHLQSYNINAILEQYRASHLFLDVLVSLLSNVAKSYQSNTAQTIWSRVTQYYLLNPQPGKTYLLNTVVHVNCCYLCWWCFSIYPLPSLEQICLLSQGRMPPPPHTRKHIIRWIVLNTLHFK